jgi:hypothetical protein
MTQPINAEDNSCGAVTILKGESMDALFLLGQLICLAGLAYGAWICLACAGRYNAESAHADAAASRAAHTRGHAQPVILIEPVNRTTESTEASVRICASDDTRVAASS